MKILILSAVIAFASVNASAAEDGELPGLTYATQHKSCRQVPRFSSNISVAEESRSADPERQTYAYRVEKMETVCGD